MRNVLYKKYSVFFVIIIYVLSFFFQSFSFLDFNKVYAKENQLKYTNLVAIFIDNSIYSSLQNEIEWYAKKYIQGSDVNLRYSSISNSKAIVLPVDINAISANEITKILENMYFDGVSGEPSKLIGTILIGEIPMPVVNHNGFIYPTIYPYVDFEEQKFIWNDDIKYFVYNDNSKGQAEIWHGLISFDTIQEYKNYFKKLQTYAENPSSFIGKNIRYEDFIANKQYFYQEGLSAYINNFLFAEDIGYRRYSDLMLNIMQGVHNTNMMSTFANMPDSDGLVDLLDGMDEVLNMTNDISVPTMSLEKMIKEGYLQSYLSLFGEKQLSRALENVDTSNRWLEKLIDSDGKVNTHTSMDTHYTMINQKDETVLRLNGGLEPLLISINNVLEQIVDDKIQKEKYWLNDVIPLSYLKYEGYDKSPWWSNVKRCTWKVYDAYENYFFGLPAYSLESMQQTSTFRGTFRNFNDIVNLTINAIQNSTIPSLDIDSIDLNKKSVGGSYDIFATQVDANRGYNIRSAESELKIYDNNKIAKREYRSTECEKEALGICWKKRKWKSSTKDEYLCKPNDKTKQGGCETPEEFAMRNRGGASSLNLDAGNNYIWKNGYNFQDAIMPIFDIAGSKALYSAEGEANSFEGIKKYSRLIQKTFVANQKKFYFKNKAQENPDMFGLGYNSWMGEDMKFTNWLPTVDLDHPTWQYTDPISFFNKDIDFFSRYYSPNANVEWEGNILKIHVKEPGDCLGKGEILTFRTLDSRVKNTLSNKKEIEGTAYKVFVDKSSPSKIFYEGIKDRLSSAHIQVVNIVNDLQNNGTGGIIYSLNLIKNRIDLINDKINSIINTSTGSIASLSDTEIDNKAKEWSSAFTVSDYTGIQSESEYIKEQFLFLSGFIENFDFEYVNVYILDQMDKFTVNEQHLWMLESWQNELLGTLQDTIQKFGSIKPLVQNIEDSYNNIDRLSLGVYNQLQSKYNEINAIGGSNTGCNQGVKYYNLCQAILNLKTNVSSYGFDVNGEIDNLEDIKYKDLDGEGNEIGSFISWGNPFTNIYSLFGSPNHGIYMTYQKVAYLIKSLNTKSDPEFVDFIPGMNRTTSDRPIDSPKYLTFKGIGGDKVTFIYPNIYKSEIFNGNSNILKLKTPQEISYAIKNYLIKTAKQYNSYLLEQKNKSNSLYNNKSAAYDKLRGLNSEGDPLAYPKIITSERPYNLMPENYLILELEKKLQNNLFFKENMGGYEPIEFLAHIVYYHNLGRGQREIGPTIQEDIDNIISDFDINEKILYTIQTFLIKDNNRGSYITPGYRDEGYEVAFINSDGNDYLFAKAEPPYIESIKSASSNYSFPDSPIVDQTTLEEELSNACNIPEAEGVDLFKKDVSGFYSPRINALKCWREKIKKSPFDIKIDRSNAQGPVFDPDLFEGSFGEFVGNMVGMDNVESQYLNQLGYINSEENNKSILDNSTPGDYQKLDKILSYAQLKTSKSTINADDATGIVSITSTVSLGDVNFYIKNVGNSVLEIQETDFSSWKNISEGTTGFVVGNMVFDPFYTKDINFKISTPTVGSELLVLYMCLPGITNINNCVKKTLKLNIVPGQVNNVKIIAGSTGAIQGSKIPIKVIGEDKFGNNVGQLISERFEISTSTGTLSYQSSIGENIFFSDFNSSDFMLNVDKNIAHNTIINLKVDGVIDGIKTTFDVEHIKIIQGHLKIYDGNNAIQNMTINLPSVNDYAYKDSFDLLQSNLNTLPKIKLRLQDFQGHTINIRTFINISSKNGLIKPGEIEQRNIIKTQNNNTFQVIQKRFAQNNNFVIEDGELWVYLMPNFKAGNDTITISIPGLDPILLNVLVNPAPASAIELNTIKDVIMQNSNTKVNLRIYDNRGNIVKKNTQIILGVAGAINISGTSLASMNKNVSNGNLDFEIKSKDKGGNGFIYAQINGLDLLEQKPGNKTILVQGKMLPDNNLNIMYLNLFGGDRGNQRGFMSDNNKYIQTLINNSQKLITTTTQLIDPENIRQFPVIVSPKLYFTQTESAEILFHLSNKLVFDVADMGEIRVDLSEISLKGFKSDDDQLENKINNLSKNTYGNKNGIFYISENTDSLVESNEVKQNSIWINGDNVFNLNNKTQDEKLAIELTNRELAGYQVWEINLDGKKVGELIFVFNKESNVHIGVQSNNIDYASEEIWINGSTNQKGFGFFRTKSRLTNTHLGYSSIQDSKDPTLGIGFTADFKNISEFGAGKSVGEATIPFASEFLINIGDPLLKRIDINENSTILDLETGDEVDSGFDRGLGEVVYSEPGKTIFKVINIDFNNDGLEDIIVAFTDGTIKLLKNYGGTTPFKPLGDLMVLADGIKEIIVGDVDWNGYKDIVIWNDSDMLRVYKNSYGVFDVDGLPICINTNVKEGEISETPQLVDSIGQIFFEDMDNDGYLDIIINDDLGYIKIFYGGQTNGKDNYVSTNKNLCDDDWYQRQNNNTNIIYRFGLRINENTKVLDSSLVRWKGLNSDVVLTNDTQVVDMGKFDNLKGDDLMDEANMDDIVSSLMAFDANIASQEYRDVKRYKTSDIGIDPVYEEGFNQTIEYVDIGCLTGTDPVKIYKQYEDINGGILENGDKVQVTVTIKALSSFTGTFIDMISGPRIIPITGNSNMIENFWFEPGIISTGKIENQLKFYRDLGNGRYMIDNLSMNVGEEIKIHYRIFYDGNVELNKIEIKDIDGNKYDKFGGNNGGKLSDYPLDALKDIRILPTDGCNKSMFVLFNENKIGNRTYVLEYIDMAKVLNDLTNLNQSTLENAQNDLISSITPNSQGDIIDMNDIPGVDPLNESWNILTDIRSDTFNWEHILSNNGLNLTNITNIVSNVVDGLAGDITKKIDSFMKGACEGFDLSNFGMGGNGGCGLPVPFNQSFLAPGEYHLFGCFKKPLLPLTNTIGQGLPIIAIPTTGPIPFWPPNPMGAGGIFGGNVSQFRLYVIPTITAHVGIAMCFGPYSLGMKVPDPISSVAGNCIVMSFPLPCNKTNNDPSRDNYISDSIADLGDTNVCNGYLPCYIGENESYSSLELVSSNASTNNLTLSIPDGSFAGGFIQIDKTPTMIEGYKLGDSEIVVEGMTLKGGTNTKNKILGGESKGFMKELIQKILDNQISHIFNNLSNFKLDIKWPNFDGLVKVGNLFKTVDVSEKELDCKRNGGVRVNDKEKCKISPEQSCKNKGMEWNNGTKTCQKKMIEDSNQGLLGNLENRSNKNLMNRGAIEGWSNYGFANPSERLEKIFDDVPLINLRTENIVVNIPMITSEDISAYISMSKTWILEQERILQQRIDLIKSILGMCGWNGEINDFEDLQEAIKNIKQNLEKQFKDDIKSLETEFNDFTESQNEDKDKMTQEIDDIKKKLQHLEELSTSYDLDELGNYTLFEGCEDGKFLIRVESKQVPGNIIPTDIYILYEPNNINDELSMFTQGYDLIQKQLGKKTKVSIKENGHKISNDNLCFKQTTTTISNQCVNLFLGGKFDALLNNIFNIQTNATLLIDTIKQNLDTLELYKKFPLDLYEWIHVGDRYLGETASLVNNVLGTISMRAQTNATRYSQYIDAIILIKTVLETYQVLIDVSKNWSEKCGTCTQDNYDEFACKLSMLCPTSLPTINIPPFKIPSIFMDLSKLNLGIDVKLPKFSFKATTIPLPKLPTLPEPPKVDVFIDMEQALSMGIDVFAELFGLDSLGKFSIPAIPLIPEPPTLPQLPSFIPNIKMDLPLLPPAPKIPKLPNELKTIINTVELAAKILCIVKKKFGLVGEYAIKAKVEQMTQRTYEIPYWDNLEQNIFSSKTNIPDWIKTSFSFLQSNLFEEVDVKGVDIGIESVVNIQFDFDGVFDFTNSIVGYVNDLSKKYTTDLAQEGVDWVNQYSRNIEQWMNICVSNPTSKECLMEYYTNEIDDLNKQVEGLNVKIKTNFNLIVSGQEELSSLMQAKKTLSNKKDDLEFKANELQVNMGQLEEILINLEGDLAITTDEVRINNLNEKIVKNKQLLDNMKEEFNKNQIELYEINKNIHEFDLKHGDWIDTYNKYFDLEGELKAELDNKMFKLMELSKEAIEKIKGKLNNDLQNVDMYLDENDALQTIKEWNEKIESQLEEKQNTEKNKQDQRKSNVQNLYKDINSVGDVDNISYIDYSKDSYEESKKILTTTINNIIDKSDNSAINQRMRDALMILNGDHGLFIKEENIKDLGQKYLVTVESLLEDNKQLADMVKQDYDKFLYVVENDKRLVSEGGLEISLSTKLFDMDQNLLDGIKGMPNIHQQYLDYYSYQVDGYLNALNNNSADVLNMSLNDYDETKHYMTTLSEQTKLALNALNDRTLLAQNINSSSNNVNSMTNDSIDLAEYVNVIKTSQGNITLANKGYTKTFQGKYVSVDINGDGKDDLLLWDKHSVYVKYRDNNYAHHNQRYYNKYYKYNIMSYNNLLQNSEEGFIKINDIYLKLCDEHREVKNFKYNGGDFDSININWLNSKVLGDAVNGYLIKMIHRVDLFDDKEKIINNSNRDFFDKKYVLVLPKGSNITGVKVGLEEGITDIISQLDGLIWDIQYYNEGQEKISLTLREIPRNWQYTQIYTLKLEGDILYQISNSSSNQVVGGPQIVGDDRGPISNVSLYRPAIDELIDGGENFELYVGTRYILKVDWEDNIGLDKMWISDGEGNIIKQIGSVNHTSGLIQLDNLYFTGVGVNQYYCVATNILGNTNSVAITLNIKSPEIKINDINIYGEMNGISIPMNVIAELSHDIDDGYVQFLRKRNTNWEIITGSMGGLKLDKYKVSPLQTVITGGYFDFGNDIGLYLSDGDLAAKIDPQNGKISINDTYQNRITLKLDFMNRIPMVIIMDGDEQIFAVVFNSKELLKIDTNLELRKLEGDMFGEFNGGQAVIYNDNVLMYISPRGKIFVEDNLYGNYLFNEQNDSVIYKFRKTEDGNDLGSIEIKVANLLES